MRLSPASRLTDRQMIWVARNNDDSPFNRLTDPVGHSAWVWATQFADAHASDVRLPFQRR